MMMMMMMICPTHPRVRTGQPGHSGLAVRDLGAASDDPTPQRR